MVGKFEKVNKSFNSFKPLLSKILTKAWENSTTKIYSSSLENWKIWADQFPYFSSISYRTLHDALSSNRKSIPSY